MYSKEMVCTLYVVCALYNYRHLLLSAISLLMIVFLSFLWIVAQIRNTETLIKNHHKPIVVLSAVCISRRRLQTNKCIKTYLSCHLESFYYHNLVREWKCEHVMVFQLKVTIVFLKKFKCIYNVIITNSYQSSLTINI